MLIPALVLCAVEAALRIGGYGYSTAFFKRGVLNGRQVLVENDKFTLRFFPERVARWPSPLVMDARKPEGTCRVFIFGESAALGDPRPHFAAARYLETMLRERYPDTRFEFVNTAITAINSHVILPIARECASREGDIWIVYMGNNEMVGPYGAATVFGPKAPPTFFVRFSLGLRELKLGQLLVDLADRARPANTAPSKWKGMEMFLQNQVPPDSPARRVVQSSFEKNLRDILKAGTRAGARVVLSTVSVNLKDCPPFASLSATNLPAEVRARLHETVMKSQAAERDLQFAQAAEGYREALGMVGTSAELHYRLGRCLLQAGKLEDARAQFQKAVDCDTLPFRADSKLNGIVRELSQRFARNGVVLADAHAELNAGAPEGIAGQDTFFEHVHFDFEGNYRLARVWAAAVEELLAGQSKGKSDDWLTQKECEERLALTDWNRVSVLQDVVDRSSQPPLSNQSNNAERQEAFRARIEALKAGMSDSAAAAAANVCIAALAKAPEDRMLHESYAEFLEANKSPVEAISVRKKIRDLAPHHYFPHYSLGTLLKEQRRFEEARESLGEAVRLAPRLAEPRVELGSVYALSRRFEDALREFSMAVQLQPDDPKVLTQQGEVFWNLNRRPEAFAAFGKAVEINPGYWSARYRLGEKLALSGETKPAIAELTEVIRLKPDHFQARFKLAVLLLKTGQPEAAQQHLRVAEQLEPDNRLLLELKEQAIRGALVRTGRR